jgi:muramoyltetrapeptide carboxypeptidase LdcA involved in peptidoglycan recycling
VNELLALKNENGFVLFARVGGYNNAELADFHDLAILAIRQTPLLGHSELDISALKNLVSLQTLDLNAISVMFGKSRSKFVL